MTSVGAPQGGPAAPDPSAPVPDVLGDGWVARTLPLRRDAVEARTGVAPVATLVHRERADPPTRGAVLQLHGFVDYFFHAHVADALAAAGWDVHGLDLRDHGRSIRPGRPPNTTHELATYAEEIDAAVALLRGTHREVVLLGHSTGGLTAALWAHARRGRGLVDAVVLNSPWLDLQKPQPQRALATAAVAVLARVAPRATVGQLGEHYGRALHTGTGGEWSYDLAWKPHEGFGVTAEFLDAVRRGHRRVAHGLEIDVPVLVLASDGRGPDDVWHDALLTTDSVLDPAQMRARAPLLGPDVTFTTVVGGAHDLALSPSPARETYVHEVLTFLDARLPA